MKDFLKSPKTRATIWILGALIVIIFVFGLGVFVGYRRAVFASRFGDNYYHNFYGDPLAGLMGAPGGPPPFNTHGVAGQIIDLSTSTISVKDQSGAERSVVVDSGTAIRDMNTTVTIEAMSVGEGVTVIGEANPAGQIEARFIRVFPTSTAMPPPEPGFQP